MSRQGVDDEKRERIEAARARGCNGRDDVVEGEMMSRKDCREGQDVEKLPRPAFPAGPRWPRFDPNQLR